MVSGYQHSKNEDSGGEETFSFRMATARTIMYCVFHRLLGASTRREAKRLSARWRQGDPLWARPWREDPSLLWKFFFERGEQVVALVALFLGKAKQGGRTRTTGHVQRPGVGTE